MNKRRRKKALKKFFASTAFQKMGEQCVKDFFFHAETPIMNTLLGKKPYKYKDIWDKP